MSRDAINRMAAKYPNSSVLTLYGERLDSLTREELMAAVAMYIEWDRDRSHELAERAERAERARAREHQTWLVTILGERGWFW